MLQDGFYTGAPVRIGGHAVAVVCGFWMVSGAEREQELKGMMEREAEHLSTVLESWATP